jgi:hypothetical protein
MAFCCMALLAAINLFIASSSSSLTPKTPWRTGPLSSVQSYQIFLILIWCIYKVLYPERPNHCETHDRYQRKSARHSTTFSDVRFKESLQSRCISCYFLTTAYQLRSSTETLVDISFLGFHTLWLAGYTSFLACRPGLQT